MSERYHPDSDQVAFVDSVSKSLASILPLSRLHTSGATSAPTSGATSAPTSGATSAPTAHEESSQIWADLSNLGVFGIAAPEQEGGSGLGAAEEALIVIELGRRVVSPAVLATIGATHLPGAAKRLPPSAEHRVAAGYRTGHRGERVVFIEDSTAQLVLVRGEQGAGLFERPTASRVLDAQLWSNRLSQADGLGRLVAEATPQQAMMLRLLDAAALAGIARAAQEMAVGYAGMREQFGRPIGSQQAVKHHCANMAIAARLACDQVSFAAIALDDGRADAALQIESAFYVAGSAAIDNCGKNIQVHGGMGFSDEADPHLLLKQARVYVEIAGGLEAALTRVGALPPSAELTEHALRGGK
jgi:alkylation response protein AidB-like acyl-CoA dehydrogenase